MPTKQLIECDIWIDDWFDSLSNSQKLLYLYLLTNKNITPAGIYQLDKIHLKHLGYTISDIEKMSPKVEYDKINNIVWLKKYFIYNSSKSEKIRKSVQNTLDKYTKSKITRNFIKYYKHFKFKEKDIGYPIDAILSYDNEHEHDNEHDKEKEHEVNPSRNFIGKFNITPDIKALIDAYPKKKNINGGVKKIESLDPSEMKNFQKALNNYMQSVKDSDVKYIKQLGNFVDEYRKWVQVLDAGLVYRAICGDYVELGELEEKWVSDHGGLHKLGLTNEYAVKQMLGLK